MSMGRQSNSRRRGILRAQTGQAMLEVALLTPLLLAMVLGAIEIGRYAYISILVGNAAHAGALYGSQSLAQATATAASPTVNPGIKLAADNDFQNNGQSIADLTVTSTEICGCDDGGTFLAAAGCTYSNNPTAGSCTSGHWVVTVEVTATGTFHSLFNYPWIPNSITVTRISTMRVDQQ
jgi:Flp pilus assembly protein TadG